jgi:hypothetical protein
MNEKIAPPAKKKANRRYYLHRMVKGFLRIDVGQRTMYYHKDLLETITVKQIQYFLELQMKFNYVAQQEIL